MTVAEVFEQIPNYFNPAAAAGVNKTILFNITGTEAGTWAVKIANQTCEVIRNEVEKPDLTLTISDKDWLAIIDGKLNPMTAYMTGKLKATGDLMLAMRITNLFKLS